MKTNNSWRALTIVVALALLLSLFSTAATAAPATTVSFTILHTNDFHGQLEASGSNPGAAKLAGFANSVRASVGADNVILVDGGDEMQGSLLSNLTQGAATIATFNAMGYEVATFGNHEFDWGQTVLGTRTGEASYPYVTANIVQNDTGNCATAGWALPAFATAPYFIKEIGTAPNNVKVAFIGVTTPETPTITIASATAGLCFKDAADSIIHYYDAMKADGADVIVVLSHLGYADGGYGYGIPVYGDQTLATKLNTAGKPVNLIIGAHSHTNLSAATTVGNTKVVQAYYNGRNMGRADVTVSDTGAVSITWSTNPISGATADPTIAGVVTSYATDPAYVALINQPIGYAQVDLLRNYNGDSMMGDFIDDAIYNYLNNDGDPLSDVDMFFNNAGGIRIDWCEKEDTANPGTYIWSSSAADCNAGVWAHDPMLLTYGQMFQILPFGNATAVGDMTGAKIMELLHQSATLFKGAIQPAGIRYKFFRYSDALPGPQPYAWGAYDVEVYNKTTHTWEPLDLTKTYRVGTNEFLAPAGQDGYTPFKYMTNISYWGDMLNAVNAYVSATYTFANPYKGPNGDGTLDGRITRDGNGDNTYDAGEIVPLTVLHHNDSHGNLDKGTYVGYTQLAKYINQERAHNPSRTLLLSAGDNIQGDAMSYYFKTAPTGFANDGTPIPDASMHMQPLIKMFNAMNYDAMTLGNHEFNFGKDVFTSVLSQATFPLLQANIADDGSYGLATANIQPYVEKTVGGDINVAILGIGNHRVPNYELPSNIPGLTFSNPITKAQELSTLLGPTNDVVIALTHIGFTENPSSVEVDLNVDTNLAATTNGIDAVIGSHSHTDPAVGFGAYKYLPTILANSDGDPVVVTQAYRYNNTLGEVSMGLRPLGGGNYEVVSQTGRYIKVATADAEDPAMDAIITPYTTMLASYNNMPLGNTTVAIDALSAFTQETNAANLQADASVYELEKNGIPVDFHLSGAMTNKAVATVGPYPVALKVSDMFSLMPYENSLVVMRMNGPQLKTVLERAYRNYWYYKYVSDWGGYSHYTTCMLDTNAGNRIVYDDRYPELPDGNNVVSLTIGGVPVNFADATKYYNVSTVNYLAAGSCNFNDAGVSLWPLGQIEADTQLYVRDAVIDYIAYQGTVSPAIEGRLQFAPDLTAPTVVSSVRAGSSPTKAASIPFTVTFSEPVSGVGTSDFSLTSVGPIGAFVASVSGGPTVYTVNVNTGTGNGTIRLNVRSTASIYDGFGNLLSGTPYLTGESYVVDKTAPLVTVPADITGVEAVDASGAVVTFAATATDADPASPAVTCDPASGSIFPLGDTTVTCSATDTAGNTGSKTFKVNVVDTTKPTLTVPVDILGVEATSPAGTVVNFIATATDTVDAAPVVACVPASGSVFPLGSTVVNCTATDASGNVDNGSFTVEVVDTTAPVLNLPANITTDATSVLGANVNFVAAANDIVDPAPVVTCDPASGSLFPVGATTVDCSATDANGNAANGSFTVTVKDTGTTVILYSPSAGETLHYNKPTFDWSNYTGAIGYQLVLSRYANASSPFLTANISTPVSQYTPVNPLAAKAHLYWRVRAKLTATTYGPWSSINDFFTANPPSTPVLLSPGINALTYDTTPYLDWAGSTVPTGTTFDHYQVQVDNNADFSSPVVNENVTIQAVHNYTVTTPLNPNSVYYWRVRSWNTNGDYSLWSTVRAFREAMLPPALISPVGTSLITDLRPTLTWTPVSGATSYVVQVSKTPTFSTLVLNKTVTTNTYSFTANLVHATQYYWRVKAGGPNGPSLWSVYESFVTP